MTIDMENAFKLPREHRYRNISVFWIFYYPRMVALLYRLRIRHEAVTLISLAFGILAGVYLLRPGYHSLLLTALFMHLKDIFDASDGSLARLRGQTNRIARFLDSLCDLLAITWLLVALAIRTWPQFGAWSMVLTVGAWVSIFLQCSYFNYYLVSYTARYGKTNVRTDERATASDRRIYAIKWKRYLLLWLQRCYGLVYGWQDRIMAAVDRASLHRAAGKPAAALDGGVLEEWYGNKQLMTLNSPLCFGTHLFIFILCALLSRPEFFYYIVILPANAFLLFNIRYRERMMGKRFGGG